MLVTWSVAALLLTALPFNLVGRDTTLYGFGVMAAFLAIFCVGALAASAPLSQRPAQYVPFDWRRSERLLRIVAGVALAALAVELQRRNFLDFGASFDEREGRSLAVIEGVVSDASVAFQIAFLLFPASLVYLVIKIGFSARISIVDLSVFGAAPIIGASLALGGRSPILYAVAVIILSLGIRRRVLGHGLIRIPRLSSTGLYLFAGLAFLVSLVFISWIFTVRAEKVGGFETSFAYAALNWGVGLQSGWEQMGNEFIGEANTYTLFVSFWYIIQGMVMGNLIFTDYSGPAGYGVYSVDIVTAIVRRFDQGLASEPIQQLFALNIAGFSPSAFGSLYVDFYFGGLVVTGAWGYLVGVVYRKTREARDARWLIFVPFVSFGIVFSLVNTPFGFANGFIVHIWLVVAFLLSRIATAGSLPGRIAH